MSSTRHANHAMRQSIPQGTDRFLSRGNPPVGASTTGETFHLWLKSCELLLLFAEANPQRNSTLRPSSVNEKWPRHCALFKIVVVQSIKLQHRASRRVGTALHMRLTATRLAANQCPTPQPARL